MNAWADAFVRVPELLVAHVQISFSAILTALIICLPLAIWAARDKVVAGWVLFFASAIQTIPALALLALFYPLLLGASALVGGGLPAFGFLPALMALTLYALLPILRNSVTGLTGIAPAITQAADGLGMTRLQKLRLVEAPLAAPTIMAGVRTASVWTIGAATLATTIGQPSLGDLIFAGLQTQNWALVLAGCIASAGLAISVDIVLGLIERAIRTRRTWLFRAATGMLVLGLFAAIVPALLPQPRTIVIGTKSFSEQYILARLIGQRLEQQGYRVRYRDGLGSAVVFRAVASGDIDIAIDYSGTIWTNEMRETSNPPAKEMLREVAKWIEARHGAKMVGALGFENTYAFAVRGETAKRYGLKTLDDLAQASPDLAMGTDTEFLERPEWVGVKALYPMQFRATRSYNPTFMYPALASGEVDAITVYSSDGRIASNKFVVLDDVRGAIPAYDAMLIASPQARRDSRIMAVLGGLTGRISVEDMREANYMVDRDTDKRTPAEAASWLDRQIIARIEAAPANPLSPR